MIANRVGRALGRWGLSRDRGMRIGSWEGREWGPQSYIYLIHWGCCTKKAEDHCSEGSQRSELTCQNMALLLVFSPQHCGPGRKPRAFWAIIQEFLCGWNWKHPQWQTTTILLPDYGKVGATTAKKAMISLENHRVLWSCTAPGQL